MSRFDDFPLGIDPEGRPWPVHAPGSVDRDHGLGALYGLAIGDALGTTAPRPGQISADTQMAICLASSMMREGGFRQEAVAASYVDWLDRAFDVGNQTRSALLMIRGGTAPAVAGRAVWEQAGRDAAGNGSLMRTVPIALFYHGDDDRRREVTLLDSAITHFDPRCQLACAAFNAAVGRALGPGPVTGRQMTEAAAQELPEARRRLLADQPGHLREIQRAEEVLQEDLLVAARPDSDLYRPELHLLQRGGDVRVAFRLAFWHLLHTERFEAALVDVVNRGADADTNGAVTGALLGARVGAAAIPERWRREVKDAPRGDPQSLSDTHHPTRLLALVRGG